MRLTDRDFDVSEEGDQTVEEQGEYLVDEIEYEYSTGTIGGREEEGDLTDVPVTLVTARITERETDEQ